MPKTPLVERVLTELEGGPQKKSELLKRLQQDNPVSIQGIYKTLGILRKKDMVTFHGDTVGLSLWWIDREIRRMNRISQAYDSQIRTHSFLALRPGEYTKLQFQTLQEIELYWTQVFLVIEKGLPNILPVYSLVPHDWFYYARPETDMFWLKQQKNRVQRLIITHPLTIDREILHIRAQQKMEVLFNKNPFKQKENEYINILGSFVLEARLDQKINAELIAWMNARPRVSEGNPSISIPPMHMRGIFTLKISNAPRRADKMTARLKKFF